jgi:hypothetical protein
MRAKLDLEENVNAIVISPWNFKYIFTGSLDSIDVVDNFLQDVLHD